jgi:Flagellar hook-length control protein FliK
MNTGAVSQPPIATGEATADRSRNTGRKSDGDNEGGGFAGLLSKLAGKREHGDRQPGSALEAPDKAGDRSPVLDWLQAKIEAGGQEERAAATEPERAIAQRDGGAGGLTDIDVTALMQILGGSGALAGANGLAAMAGRVANGTATEAETALMQAAVTAQEEGETLSPERLILASLAKAAGRTEEPASGDVKTATATLTVLRRETHLAPVANGVEWTARPAAEGNRSLRAVATPGEEVSGDIQPLQSDHGPERSGETQLANPQAAVTAVRDGKLGTDWRRGAPPMAAELQAAPDGLADAGDQASSQQAAPIGRSDALITAGVAGGGVAHQIADRVTSEASTLTAQTGRPDAPTFAVRHESAAKVLHIQLQPEGLGTVALRMSVKDRTLRLDLEVGRGETAHLIQRDRETLSALLRSAGYLIDGVEVRIADPTGANAQTGSGQANTPMQGGGQSGSSQPDARSSGERPQDGRRNNSFGDGSNSEDEQAGHTARGSGIYI